MFKMIGDFKFDLEQDCYVNSKNGVKLTLIPDGKTFIVRFKLDNFTKDYCMSAYWDNIEERIEDILQKENPCKELLKQIKLPSKEIIKECINKSNAAEVNFLERRVTNLENRVKTLEDSVEDLEEWRHS